jgi:DNA-binding NtrC family response regulator
MSTALIVCIDDDEELLALTSRVLRREPSFTVRTTTRPEEALEWIRSEDVAVLVTDYEMPEVTGAQLAGKAKLVRPETVRILLTGKRTFETAIDGINQGEIFRFVGKPFDEKELRKAVLDGVQRHHELAALSVDRHRHERRAAIRDALEAEYPGISNVDHHAEIVVTDDPRTAADELGLLAFRTALDRR